MRIRPMARGGGEVNRPCLCSGDGEPLLQSVSYHIRHARTPFGIAAGGRSTARECAAPRMAEQVRHDEEFCRGLAKAAERDGADPRPDNTRTSRRRCAPRGGRPRRVAWPRRSRGRLRRLPAVARRSRAAVANPGEAGSRKSRRSVIGIVVQGVGIGLGSFGPQLDRARSAVGQGADRGGGRSRC